MHTPVFADEVIQALQVIPNGKYIDATAGEGGHIARILATGAHVLGLDWDINQIDNIQTKIKNDNLKLVQSNYADIESVATENGFGSVDGILFDLGLSMKQIKDSGRGFSFNNPDEQLDMRIGSEGETAKYFLNTLSEEELYEGLSRYSEDLNSRDIAKEIAFSRRNRMIERVGDLTGAIDRALEKAVSKGSPRNQISYARIFQAVRIMVNHEFENIRKGLEGAINLIKPEGRIVVITFHSLEDRIVKQMIKGHHLVTELDKPKIPFNKIKSFERSALIRVIKKHEK